jgi:hypothetical protein
MSVEAHFHFSGCVIGQNFGHWCQETLTIFPSLVFLPPRCAVWSVSSGDTAVTDSQHHEQSQPLPEVIGTCCRTFWLQQSTVCACCIPHGCAAECSSSTTHFSIMAVRSPDLLVFPRGNEALPQTIPQLQKAFPVSQLITFTA